MEYIDILPDIVERLSKEMMDGSGEPKFSLSAKTIRGLVFNKYEIDIHINRTKVISKSATYPAFPEPEHAFESIDAEIVKELAYLGLKQMYIENISK